jgi:hypothetical protein
VQKIISHSICVKSCRKWKSLKKKDAADSYGENIKKKLEGK